MKTLFEMAVVGLLVSPVPLAIGQGGGSGDGSRAKEARDLCKRIAEIKRIPIKAREGKGGDFKDIDPVYDKFRTLGDAAVPCLIDELTNQTVTVDPRSPHFGGVVARVGDTALWVICDITGLDPASIVPASVRRESNGDLGAMAYFAWVKLPANRRVLQANVRAWWDSRQTATRQNAKTNK